LCCTKTNSNADVAVCYTNDTKDVKLKGNAFVNNDLSVSGTCLLNNKVSVYGLVMVVILNL
jgi:hypothetical protein